MSKTMKQVLAGGLVFGISNLFLALIGHFDHLCFLITTIATGIVFAIDYRIDEED